MRTIKLRPFDPSDSLQELTDLLQSAFARLGAMGLNCTCVDQSPAVTLARIAKGECYVAESGRKLIGTLTLYTPSENAECTWFRRNDVASLHQFAISPDFQGQGLGSAMLDFSEDWAKYRGYRKLALSVAQPASHLLSYYQARGYRQVGTINLPGKVYCSAVLTKKLTASAASEITYEMCGKPAAISQPNYQPIHFERGLIKAAEQPNTHS